MNMVMQYNQDDAVKASGSEYLANGGAYNITLNAPLYITAKTGSKGLEFSGVTSDGQKVNYLTCYFQKQDGTTINGGNSVIQAMMGFVGIQGISSQQNGMDQNGNPAYICPEFTGKTIGLFLQKKLYTKQNGQDGYEFSIRVPFDPQTNATLREKLANSDIKTIQRMAESYNDIDERRKSQQSQQANDEFSAPTDNNFGYSSQNF